VTPPAASEETPADESGTKTVVPLAPKAVAPVTPRTVTPPVLVPKAVTPKAGTPNG